MGGPVWHASVSGFSRASSRAKCLAALDGVGDESRGQWEEVGRTAYHVRRRLSAEEERIIGEAVDIRGTEEARRRVKQLLLEEPRIPREAAYQEAGTKRYVQ